MPGAATSIDTFRSSLTDTASSFLAAIDDDADNYYEMCESLGEGQFGEAKDNSLQFNGVLIANRSSDLMESKCEVRASIGAVKCEAVHAAAVSKHVRREAIQAAAVSKAKAAADAAAGAKEDAHAKAAADAAAAAGAEADAEAGAAADALAFATKRNSSAGGSGGNFFSFSKPRDGTSWDHFFRPLGPADKHVRKGTRAVLFTPSKDSWDHDRVHRCTSSSVGSSTNPAAGSGSGLEFTKPVQRAAFPIADDKNPSCGCCVIA